MNVKITRDYISVVTKNIRQNKPKYYSKMPKSVVGGVCNTFMKILAVSLTRCRRMRIVVESFVSIIPDYKRVK